MVENIPKADFYLGSQIDLSIVDVILTNCVLAYLEGDVER